MITVLVGLPGSGKTTWRKARPKLGVVVSSDDLVEEIAARDGVSYVEAWNKHINDAQDCAWDIFATAARAGLDTVIDMTNLTQASRRRWIGYEDQDARAIVFGNGWRSTHFISLESLAWMRNRYSQPTLAEGFVSVEIAR